jgi:NAD-dependent dihydropyrimidine dehydrogenase PreA subunit
MDPQGCIDCGACVPACTSDSIKPVEDLAEDQKEFVASNAGFFSK